MYSCIKLNVFTFVPDLCVYCLILWWGVLWGQFGIRFGTIWESRWDQARIVLGYCWNRVGRVGMARLGINLGSCCDHFGIVLGETRDRFGHMSLHAFDIFVDLFIGGSPLHHHPSPYWQMPGPRYFKHIYRFTFDIFSVHSGSPRGFARSRWVDPSEIAPPVSALSVWTFHMVFPTF